MCTQFVYRVIIYQKPQALVLAQNSGGDLLSDAALCLPTDHAEIAVFSPLLAPAVKMRERHLTSWAL